MLFTNPLPMDAVMLVVFYTDNNQTLLCVVIKT